MGFIHKCFISKNTAELREKLIQIGCKIISASEYNILICNNGFVNDVESINGIIGFNCGINENLFLAIAAKRDDSDYLQWFVNKNTGEFKQFKPEYSPKDSSAFKFFREDVWHKATVEELIEYFK